MKDLIKVVLIILCLAFVIRFCRANFSDMQENETYISTANSNVKIQLTKEDDVSYSDAGIPSSPRHIAYLYIDGAKYKGHYNLYVSNQLKKDLSIDFYGYNESVDNPRGLLFGHFYVKRNKIVVKDVTYSDSIFKENNTFTRKTWWNTWGKKGIIILAILLIIWLLRIPEFIMNKKYREESINEFRESKKEYDKVRAEGKMYYDKEVSEYREMMNEGINELKNTMKEAKEGVTEMKDILKKGLEEYKKDNKKG